MARDDQPPYFPFYPDDFVSSGTVECMSTKGVGAYILLLCKAWREAPPASLPDSDPVLARWARVSVDEWRELRSEVLSAWSLQGGRWHNRRLRSEYDRYVRKRKELQDAGREGAVKRWGEKMATPKPPHGHPMARPKQAVAVAVPEEPQVVASSSPRTRGEGRFKGNEISKESEAVARAVEFTGDDGSRAFFQKAVKELGPGLLDEAVGEVKARDLDGSVSHRAKYLTALLNDWIKGRAENLGGHR